MSSAEDNRGFEELIEFIKQSRGFDFTGYKTASLMRRVRRRMQSLNLERFGEYMDYLEVHPEEFILLFNTILINVTSFFRDPLTWECLTQEVVPEILAGRNAEQPVRVWSAGCASGEEAYTLAMVFAEALGLEQFQQRVKIYATDVDEEALARARHASYTEKEMEPLPVALREKYFDRVADRYVFRSDPRRAVIFGRHDLIQDAPISRLDLLVCRNTLMYFNAETQGRVISRFHFALNDQGFLFLGKAELLLAHASHFTPANLRFRLFRKIPQPYSRNHLLLLEQDRMPEAVATSARQARLRDALLEAVPVATIVVDSNGNLALATKQARDLFSLTAGNLGQPFRDLEMSYRPVELRSLIDEAMAKRLPISLRDVEWPMLANGVRYLDVQVAPLLEADSAVSGTIISFTDVTSSHRLREELQHSNEELETAYEELQSTNEELETTNEELQSTVEELETTNEELQSTNEEMETMNEELQSTNEELQTTNEELRRRTDELSRANFFLESILASVRSGVVVMDRMLNVHVWSPRAADMWGLRPDETQGQSFLNLDFGLPVERLKVAIRAIVSRESDLQELTLEAVNRRGKAIKCRVICTPLFGARKELEGTVLLMEEWGGDEQG
ncbi:MAG TPA: CheR family methyltransferase [Candidatus Binatia bacterium]|nr:CheR family methyltransferase [Candidatus Binatia bacterium]